MPSPFPGMDPSLEGPEWPSFHTPLCVQIGRQLVPLLGSNYLVRTTRSEPAGGPMPPVTVEIFDAADRSLVTSIEVLSPTNKERSGRADYLAKRLRVLRSDAHLLEIDLLRTGLRVPVLDPIPRTDYCVVLSRADRRPMADVWPISIRQVLPAVPVPLLPGDPDVSLDLQRAVTAVYDDWAYELELDYRHPPAVPLSPADAVWAADLLAGRDR